jgi:hypothetical protein
MIKQPGPYVVVDYPSTEELKALGVDRSEFRRFLPSLGMGCRKVMAVATGEKRPPRKGEWYLSGADVQAYKAPNDLTTAYHIAKLARVETQTVTTVVVGGK